MKATHKFLCDLAENISMPKIYLQVRQLIKTPDSKISDFTKIIESDSMLSIRIIRISNSDFFGFHRKAENLEQAISLIGVIQLHDLLLSCLCMRTFAAIPEQILNLKTFWETGIHCGIAAKTIAQHSMLPAGNRFFALGLLHEVGHAVMFAKSPELSFNALSDSQKQNRSLAELEREYLGFDYGQLGAELMRLWHLPAIYQQTAEYHLHPQRADTAYRDDIEIIHLANTLCLNPVIGQNNQSIAKSAEQNKQLKQLPSNIDSIVLDQINAHTDSLLSLLWPTKSLPLALKQGAL